MSQYSLRILEAKLLQHRIEPASEHHGRKLPDGSTQWGGFDISVFHPVDTLAEADGVSFLCPLCFEKNNGNVGTHGVHVYFEGSSVPNNIGLNREGKVVRWHASGTNLDDLVLTPSILLLCACEWHGFVGSNGIKPGHAG